MELLDARRLTGPNLLSNQAGSILDIRCSPAEAAELIPAWKSRIVTLLERLGWSETTICHCMLTGGVSLAFTAPIDVLYTASAINEWVYACCVADREPSGVPDLDEQLLIYSDAIAEEANPALINLEKMAKERNVALLWDDDYASLGLGRGSRTWPVRAIPAPELIDWDKFHDIPVGIVTGTNGKTTTVRLIQHILITAGLNVGISSTNWIAVNDRVIETGDWSGPGGARHVLRQTDVDVAVLETARGGLLRRGLGVNKADAALITNVSEDHLGDFGSQNLDELLSVKWVVTRALTEQGALILNADDDRLVAKSTSFNGNIVWFSLYDDNPLIIDHVNNGGTAFTLSNSCLVYVTAGKSQIICHCNEIPITLNGAARHNVENALAAAAMTVQLGASIDAVQRGLLTMSQEHNPGRSNLYTVNGISILVDFAHNPAAMQAVFDMAQALPAKRRALAFSQAGDRPDALVRESVRTGWKIGLDKVIVSELSAYHRGRQYGEIFALIKDELLRCGAKARQICHFDKELDSLQSAIDWAEPGDLVIMLALEDSAAIRAKLESLMAER